MAYRGGGDRQNPDYGGAFVRAPPVPHQPATAVYHNPAATGPHLGAYQHGVVYRTPAPGPYTIQAPSPTPATVRAPSSTLSPDAAPFQPARASAPLPAPPSTASIAKELEQKLFESETALAPPAAAAAAPFQPARVSAPLPAPPTPCTASIAKELEQKLFVSETALAPPAAAAAAAVAASQADQPPAEKAPEVDLALVSKKGLAHPARPGAGTAGTKVMVRANHFLVNVADNNLFHYDVSINPESKSRQTNREVLSELIKVHGKTSLGGKLPAYDGRKSLYTAGSLPFESEELSVTLVDPEKKDKERAEREYKITIRIAGRTDLYHLQQFLCGRQRDMPQETIQVLDVVLRESPSWNCVTVSRSFFSTTFGHRGDIGEGLECWRGYYQSLRPTQMGLSLNIDISATSFFKPVTVIQFVQEFLNLRDVSRPLTDRDRVKIKKALRGVRVETNHQKDQIRRYKITGLTPIPMSQLIFPVDERGTRMTVVQYFMQRYDYRLEHTNWPCLQSGSDARPVYLPMEACKIVEGQKYSKKLNDKQVTNILRATCQRPQQKEQSIRKMVLHNKYAEDKFAQEFGIKVCSDLVSVPARVLPPPMLKYHDSGREKTCAPSVGQWNMINKKMINGGTIDNWACLSFSRMRPEEIYRFCCDLTQMCNATGMSVNPMPVVDIMTATPNNIENALRDVHRKTAELIAKQGKGGQLQLLVVILPEVTGSYGKIKKVCETDLGIVSQCCLPRHASRPNKQYLENVALKINVKAGGRNTVLEKAFVRNGIPFVSEVPTIIFGADVTHPPPGEDSASSIAAVVPLMNAGSTLGTSGQLAVSPKSSSRIINALVEVLQYKLCIPVESGASVEELVSMIFMKLDFSFNAYIMVNSKIVSVHERLHDLIGAADTNCSVSLTGYLLGGAPLNTGQLQLLNYITSISQRLFEVVSLPDTILAPNMAPFFVSLSRESVELILLMIELLHSYHQRGACPKRFSAASVLYDSVKKELILDGIGDEQFSDTFYFHNLTDFASVLSEIFQYDEALVISNDPDIHAYGNRSPSWRIPLVVAYLINDLRVIIPCLPLNIHKNKEYLETHISTLSPFAFFSYITSQDLDTDYRGGENSLEDIVGMGRAAAAAAAAATAPPPAAVVPQPPAAAVSSQQAAFAPQPVAPSFIPIPSFEAQARSSPSFTTMFDKKNKKGRKTCRFYNFNRIGHKSSCHRNWLFHAKDHLSGIKISSKQAAAYLQLLFPGLVYNVRLRTWFPTAPVAWDIGPCPPAPYTGPLITSGLNKPWLKNEFSNEEILRLGTKKG